MQLLIHNMINDQSILGTEQTALIKFITLDEREF